MSQTAISEDMKQHISPEYVNLSSLPAPKVIEELSFENIFYDLLADFKIRSPKYDALLESDPVIIALECAAYRELLLRSRINEAAHANMLAYATGTDLDHRVEFYGTVRQDGEDDDRLRYRARLAPKSLTTAGSEQAYLFHALSASPQIKSASVQSKNKGQVLITILSDTGDGVADDGLIKTVNEYISAEDKRPLTDHVIVQTAKIIPFIIDAKIFIYPGPSISIITDTVLSGLNAYLNKQHNIGSVIAVSGLYNALHTEGVQRVELLSPESDTAVTIEQAAFCTNTNVKVEIINDRK